MMRKTSLYLFLFCSAFALFSCNSGSTTKTTTVDSASSKTVVADRGYVKMVIQYKADSAKVIDSIPINKDKFSVEDAMSYAKDTKKMLTFKDANNLLNEIDGVGGMGAKQFWWLCVNDSSSMVSYKDRLVAKNDKIIWHYLVGGQDGCKVCYCQSQSK